MNATKHLVSMDTDRIKEYLFATSDLRKLRGASALLEILNQADKKLLDRLNIDIESVQTVIRQICPELQDHEIITGGGAVLALVPPAMASQVIESVEGLYRRETITCSITGASVLTIDDDLQHHFGRCFAEVDSQLRCAKNHKGQEPFVPLTGWLRPCGACGRYPACYSSTDPEGRAELICASCHRKDEWSREARNLFWQDFLKQAGTSWLETFPKDFGAIGRTSRPSGYLGFIYADGNNMGTVLERLKTFPAFRTFANGLNTLVRQITYQAILAVLQHPRQNTAPFEILLMGGDDLMLVVAADAALDIASWIAEAFEHGANALAHGPAVGLPPTTHLSLSVGVVIAHDSFPLKAMHDLAADLLKNAKRASPAENYRGTIDFMVVTEAATTGVDSIRDGPLTDQSFAVAPSAGERFSLTERPYTVEKLRQLLKHARDFKSAGFPRTTLHALSEALFQSKVGAQFAAITSLARAKPTHQERLFEFFRDFQIPQTTLPWREVSNGAERHFSSPLGDLIEVYPFVHGRHR